MMHYKIRISKISYHTVVSHIINKGWLAEVIPGKEESSTDFFLIQVLHEFFSIDS